MHGCGSQPSSSGTPSPSPRSLSPSISRLCLRDSSTEPDAPPSAHTSDSSEDDDPDDVRYDRYHRIIIRPEDNGLSVPGRTDITVKFVKIWSINAIRDSLIPLAPLERLKRSLHGFYRMYGWICKGIGLPRNSRSRVNRERRPEHLRRVAPCTVWVQGAWGIRGDNWKKIWEEDDS
ncbi:uncharacterized protein [Nicotiana tomentosiformis]|uniref:uncharacterized protein n=1 Tax=Nicotiana tomentosiformis TaxID=4098 RepID=UPI00388C9E09